MRIVAAAMIVAVTAAPAVADKGEALFNQYCRACHRDGGNVMRPEKNLKRGSLEASGLRTPEDITKYLRKPGKGMPTYDSSRISEKDGAELGSYILKTFK